ncbi:MAG: sugar transporter ATP-binding protein [Modestobacter sp.]|nr:sugar transporter ATP-binding protein [Modestobacter sp.]MCW2575776.1 Ribose import ATP-binding protein RbsA [Modestobacter sp.]
MTDDVLVRMAGITKSYPGVAALRGVDFDLRAGEVHCLIGENGAGKSTLIRMLTGAEQPDQGVITISGQEYGGLRPALAHRLGVSAIYQETDLVPQLTVAENVFLGHEPRGRSGAMDRAGMRREARRVLDELGVTLPVDAPVSELTAANAQLVQIAKALSRNCKVLIMDEPGAVLSDHELESLFEIVRSLRARGMGIVYISHRLEELMLIGDRVTVMRDGQWVQTRAVAETSVPEIIRAMVGRELSDQYTKTAVVGDDVVLSVRGLTLRGHFEDVTFDLRRGEVLGLAGLVGAGRSELLNCIFGAIPADSGTVTLNGQPLKARSPQQAIEAGIGLVPEDRRGAGLILSRSVQENLTLPSLGRLSRGMVLRGKELAAVCRSYVEDLRIKTPSAAQPVRLLSGGNQQKVVLAKWLARGTTVLLLDEPTAGVDVGAKSEIYALMDRLASDGISILMASSELSEVLGMSDRVLVMAEGRLTCELSREEATQEVIMSHAVPMSAAIAS